MRTYAYRARLTACEVSVFSFQQLIKGTDSILPYTYPRVFLQAFLETNLCPTLYPTLVSGNNSGVEVLYDRNITTPENTPTPSLGATLRLWDTVLGVFRTQNAITHSDHLHQTMATKDGAQIERHLVRTHNQKAVKLLNQNLTS